MIRLKREANTGLGLSRADNALIKVPSERLQRERKYVKENSGLASIRILSPLRQVEITPTPFIPELSVAGGEYTSAINLFMPTLWQLEMKQNQCDF